MSDDNIEKKRFNLYYIILEDMENHRLSYEISEQIKNNIFKALGFE